MLGMGRRAVATGRAVDLGALVALACHVLLDLGLACDVERAVGVVGDSLRARTRGRADRRFWCVFSSRRAPCRTCKLARKPRSTPQHRPLNKLLLPGPPSNKPPTPNHIQSKKKTPTMELRLMATMAALLRSSTAVTGLDMEARPRGFW